jgi:hypothetical protein
MQLLRREGMVLDKNKRIPAERAFFSGGIRELANLGGTASDPCLIAAVRDSEDCPGQEGRSFR